jgi:hypothetical protein
MFSVEQKPYYVKLMINEGYTTKSKSKSGVSMALNSRIFILERYIKQRHYSFISIFKNILKRSYDSKKQVCNLRAFLEGKYNTPTN